VTVVCDHVIMPRRPPTVGPRDDRLDPYRERAGLLSEIPSGQLVATVFVRVVCYWDTRGFLWWKHFSNPHEVPHGLLLDTDGRFDDFVDPIEEVAKDINDWSRGLFRLRGRTLSVVWLDDSESQMICENAFGLRPSPI
jgi:hypothetical protein